MDQLCGGQFPLHANQQHRHEKERPWRQWILTYQNRDQTPLHPRWAASEMRSASPDHPFLPDLKGKFLYSVLSFHNCPVPVDMHSHLYWDFLVCAPSTLYCGRLPYSENVSRNPTPQEISECLHSQVLSMGPFLHTVSPSLTFIWMLIFCAHSWDVGDIQ